MDLRELQQWFINRKGYYHTEIKRDPSMSNPNRQVLYASAHNITWKIYNDELSPIYLGTGYMWNYIVDDIIAVKEKVRELNGRT